MKPAASHGSSVPVVRRVSASALAVLRTLIFHVDEAYTINMEYQRDDYHVHLIVYYLILVPQAGPHRRRALGMPTPHPDQVC
jgi:hypothetical protein